MLCALGVAAEVHCPSRRCLLTAHDLAEEQCCLSYEVGGVIFLIFSNCCCAQTSGDTGHANQMRCRMPGTWAACITFWMTIKVKALSGLVDACATCAALLKEIWSYAMQDRISCVHRAGKSQNAVNKE